MYMDDYDSKVSKLLNNFLSDEMEIDNTTPTTKQINNKIEFISEKNNDNVLVNLTNDERYLIEIKKESINFELGDKILLSFKDELKYKKDKIKEISDNKVINSSPKQSEKKKFSVSIKPSSKKNTLFSTNKIDSSALIQNDKNKIPKLKISYKDYFYSTPKCDLCENTGITIDEFKKITNKQVTVDALVLDYLLYQCSTCKVYLHSSCAFEANFPSFTGISKDKFLLNSNWTCDKCKTVSDAQVTSECQICYKKDSQLKKPHFYKNVDNNWIHYWCLLWFINKNETDFNSFSIKLKQFYLTNTNNKTCDICGDNNTKLFTMKCSNEECQKHFHPICIKEAIHYSNSTNVDGCLISVCYCEEHSQKFLMSQFK